jgi:hypothetical protein
VSVGDEADAHKDRIKELRARSKEIEGGEARYEA